MLKCMEIRRHGTKITSVFNELANEPDYVSDAAVDVLEYYVARLYSADFSQSSLTKKRVSHLEHSIDNDVSRMLMLTGKTVLSSGRVLVSKMDS